MYICVCNGINDKQVRKAVKKGAQTVGRVFKEHDCKADCAQCVNCIRNVIKEETHSSDVMFAAE